MCAASSGVYTASSDVCTASSGMCTASSDVCTASNGVCTASSDVCVQFSTGVHVPMSQMCVLCDDCGTDYRLCEISLSPQSSEVSGEKCELISLFHGWL